MRSSAALAHQRVVAQGIVVPRSVTAAEIVTRLGAVQAQDYPGALWSIALRTAGATRAEIGREARPAAPTVIAGSRANLVWSSP
jgi:hypothetical protein